ncbi:MAG: hypothetical protein WBO55_16115 [Rhizobiaceae bacterium]
MKSNAVNNHQSTTTAAGIEGDTAMNNTRLRRRPSALRYTLTSVLALAVALGSSLPAYAAITNTGSISGSTPSGGTVSDTSSESVTVASPVRSFTVAKSLVSISSGSGNDASNPDGGDTITYQYAVDNTGNISITGASVSITDPGPSFIDSGSTPHAGANSLSSIAYVSGDTDTDNNIDPDETWLYQATYSLAQADVDFAAGVTDGVTNTVTTASATAVSGGAATFDSGSSTLTALGTINENAVVNLTKVATRNGSTEDDGSGTPYDPGEDIIYLFTVVNEGNVTLSSLTVSETAFVAPSGASAPSIVCTISGTPSIATLAPGATETCTATYTVQEADL